ncbi:disulfide bond formation protein DsbD [Pseudoxanthomonas yeongjuensis]|uniref:thioredoxin family protein n=1 Tax=Pseudoxanthomonas yeongjuensis TaxID=377616 RepID=UPI001391C327|nr:thioredoxin family protein [Pseudoxanthomonas yeongjuensis]KAF1715981.1 disulfide bond formation protein DsbD [Pseudoxanthomonas yeongjuensis]
MRKLSVGSGVLLLAVAMTACGAREQAEPNPPSTTPNVSTEPDTSQPVASGNTPAAADIAAVAALNASFDPLRDPASDLETAKVEAMRGGKRIMLDVGGEWCSWCHILDKFVEEDAEIRSFRDANYVWMKVNYSEENENKPFLSAYPGIKGYPHLFVLDADGKLLHSQFTGELEKGKGYDRAKFFDFMKAWAPPASTTP